MPHTLLNLLPPMQAFTRPHNPAPPQHLHRPPHHHVSHSADSDLVPRSDPVASAAELDAYTIEHKTPALDLIHLEAHADQGKLIIKRGIYKLGEN